MDASGEFCRLSFFLDSASNTLTKFAVDHAKLSSRAFGAGSGVETGLFEHGFRGYAGLSNLDLCLELPDRCQDLPHILMPALPSLLCWALKLDSWGLRFQPTKRTIILKFDVACNCLSSTARTTLYSSKNISNRANCMEMPTKLYHRDHLH